MDGNSYIKAENEYTGWLWILPSFAIKVPVQVSVKTVSNYGAHSLYEKCTTTFKEPHYLRDSLTHLDNFLFLEAPWSRGPVIMRRDLLRTLYCPNINVNIDVNLFCPWYFKNTLRLPTENRTLHINALTIT